MPGKQRQNNNVFKWVIDTLELDAYLVLGGGSTMMMVNLVSLKSQQVSGLVVFTTNPPTFDLPHKMPGLPVPLNNSEWSSRNCSDRTFWAVITQLLDINLYQGACMPRHKRESQAASSIACGVRFRPFRLVSRLWPKRKTSCFSYSHLVFETGRSHGRFNPMLMVGGFALIASTLLHRACTNLLALLVSGISEQRPWCSDRVI
jgi:hypothetical protein